MSGFHPLTIYLTRVRGRRMLSFVRRLPARLRVATTIIAVLAIVIAAPIHAAHGHGDSGANRVHAPCAICQLQSPACRPSWEPCAGIPLEPIFVLVAVVSSSPISAPAAVDACRAPPSVIL